MRAACLIITTSAVESSGGGLCMYGCMCVVVCVWLCVCVYV